MRALQHKQCRRPSGAEIGVGEEEDNVLVRRMTDHDVMFVIGLGVG